MDEGLLAPLNRLIEYQMGRIESLEADNARLTAERDAARQWSAAWKRTAKQLNRTVKSDEWAYGELSAANFERYKQIRELQSQINQMQAENNAALVADLRSMSSVIKPRPSAERAAASELPTPLTDNGAVQINAAFAQEEA